MKLTSVVVVTYNCRSTVLETLDSIYNQTYSSLELIVSDDCSRDDTVEVVQNWIETHKGRFEDARLLTVDTNTGVAGNGNRGIFAARGEYVQLIAGDDLLLPSAMEEKVAFADENGLNYVVSRTEPFGEDAEKVESVRQYYEKGYEILAQGYNTQLEQILRNNYIAGPAGSFFKRQYMIETGGFDERYPMIEDYPFIYHYLLAGNEIPFLDKVLSRYRIAGTSLSNLSKSPMWTCHWDFFFHERFGELLRRGKIGTAVYQALFCFYRRFVQSTFIGKICLSVFKKLFRRS